MSGRIVRLEVESVAYRGAGVARNDGVVHFVPGTCPGEVVDAEVVAEKKNYRVARVRSVIRSSPDRLDTPDCLISDVGGSAIPAPGCVYGHMTHEAELRCKCAQLLEFLERQAALPRVSDALLPPVASPSALHYRNKAVFHVARQVALGRLIVGYVGEDNETVVEVPECPLSVPAINEALRELRTDREALRWAGIPGTRVTVRWTPADGVVIWATRPGGEIDPPPEELPSLVEETPVLGSMRVPARAFWQLNGPVAGALVQCVAERVEALAPNRFVDLYCGVGVFGLSCAKAAEARVVGVESGRDAIRAAVANARALGLGDRCRFECADSGVAAGRVLRECRSPGAAALVDPPRAGLSPQVVRALVENPVGTLFYVSCAPDTLARDLRLLAGPGGGGYTLREARLFDMFPRTAHFETLCVLAGPVRRR